VVSSAPSAGHAADAPELPAGVAVRTGAEMGLRSFEDSEDGRGAPRAYRALPVSGFFAGVELYPLVGRVISVEGEYAQSLGVRSTTDTRRSVATSWTRIEGLVKGRLFLGKEKRAPWLAVVGGYAHSSFVFDGVPSDREIPSGRYDIVRLGVEGQMSVDRLSLSSGLEYNRLVAIGALGDTRPSSSGDGLTARAGASFEIYPWLSARLEMRYIWCSFGLVRAVPATVIDQYATARLGLEARF
jgi:hypothetical protein